MSPSQEGTSFAEYYILLEKSNRFLEEIVFYLMNSSHTKYSNFNAPLISILILSLAHCNCFDAGQGIPRKNFLKKTIPFFQKYVIFTKARTFLAR